MGVLLSVQKLKKEFVGDVVFSDVSFQISSGQKAAIVGPNGCGKSTLLKIIAGELEADEGSVVIDRSEAIGYLAQYQDTDHADDIYEYVLHAREDILDMESRLHDIEADMNEASMEEYHTLSHNFEMMGGSSFRSEAMGVLKGLGFAEHELHRSMEELSGGQKTRVNLARLLLSDPSLLMLDEPTNHLDLSAIRWLENFLSGYKKSVLVVAHDRYFLDRVCDSIVDLSEGTSKVYTGNYSAFVEQKDIYMTARKKAFQKQQDKVKHEQEVITKLKSFNREKSVKRAESRMKKLDKIELMDDPTQRTARMKLSLSPDRESGKDVLEAEGLSKSFGEKRLFKDISFFVGRGERVFIIGENGCGKTTLLKIINEVIPQDEGVIRIGANVTIGYYDQEQQNLDETKTLYDELSDAYRGLTQTRIRNVLGAFCFSDDDVFKLVGDLSGGERGRVSLAKLMLKGSNLLILDEPTNHLDMESKEILANALLSYTGTLVCVSHDRYFINQVAQRILEITPERGVTEYLGNYDYYLKKHDERFGEAERRAKAAEKTGAGRESWEETKKKKAEERKLENKRKALEEKIEELETESSLIDEQFSDEAVATNSAKLNELTARQEEINSELEQLYEQWEELV